MNNFLLPLNLLNKKDENKIIECNNFTRERGLSLTVEEARDLVETKNYALKNTDRIEFEGGIINKIIESFYDSVYITQSDYAEVLNSLVEVFYYFKTEMWDLISDDDLIAVMKRFFEETCHGSIELLQGRELEILAYKLRNNLSSHFGKSTSNSDSYSYNDENEENYDEDFDDTSDGDE